MDSNDLESDVAFFTTNGKDVWKLVSHFTEPSCKLVNMNDTAQVQEFGISSRMARGFHRIKMPRMVGVGEPPVFVEFENED